MVMFILYYLYSNISYFLPKTQTILHYRRAWTMTKTQNKNDSHEAMEEAENHLQKPKLSKQEEPKRIQSGRYS